MARLDEVSVKHGRNLFLDFCFLEVWVSIRVDVDWGGLGKKMNVMLNVSWRRQLSGFCKNVRVASQDSGYRGWDGGVLCKG